MRRLSRTVSTRKYTQHDEEEDAEPREEADARIRARAHVRSSCEAVAAGWIDVAERRGDAHRAALDPNVRIGA
jgi:hypothetical protein